MQTICSITECKVETREIKTTSERKVAFFVHIIPANLFHFSFYLPLSTESVCQHLNEFKCRNMVASEEKKWKTDIFVRTYRALWKQCNVCICSCSLCASIRCRSQALPAYFFFSCSLPGVPMLTIVRNVCACVFVASSFVRKTDSERQFFFHRRKADISTMAE